MTDLAFLLDTVIWMSGSDDFSPGGKVHDEWERRRVRVHDILLAARQLVERPSNLSKESEEGNGDAGD